MKARGGRGNSCGTGAKIPLGSAFSVRLCALLGMRMRTMESAGKKSVVRRQSGQGRRSSDDRRILILRSTSDPNVNVSPTVQHGLLVIAVVLTIHSLYIVWSFTGDLDKASWWQAVSIVWASGWITAAATGLGTLPFICVHKLDHRLVAVCNAAAAGMMIAASLGLVFEGCMEPSEPGTVFIPPVRLLLGMYMGVGFVKGSTIFVGEADAAELIDEQVLNMRRVLVIMAVMTVHSISEGVGIGVSYHSQTLGGFISCTMAIHNIPEGVAISIVLIPRGFSILSTILWCIFSSLPQPLMAVPAYLFVDQFRFITAIGFGFAAGAMFYVAIFELLEEAQEHLSSRDSMLIMLTAMLGMGMFQVLLKDTNMLF
mmetsp:Transcript_20542/g.33930  ORF Transcript_20542/g.33930 Transcript_20542/m.33930 type:complete len:370 (+) Transcript_20542:99-1208(+)